MTQKLSIILPAKNESAGLSGLLKAIKKAHPQAELIVVDDGSMDDTGAIAEQYADKVISNPYSMGNGAAVKNGARAATGDILVFMDADGQHSPADIKRLLQTLEQGFRMAVGARGPSGQASFFRGLANHFYNRFASAMTGVKIADLTSGFRAVRAVEFKQFLYLLPNGFSYPTTITMAFLRCGFAVGYVPIEARQRTGRSKINPLGDGMRFFIIILKIGSLFSPMRLFFPISMVLFATGVTYYLYTYMAAGRFTNMGAVLFLSSLLIFLIGIISEQVSALHYHAIDKSKPDKITAGRKTRKTGAPRPR